MSLCLSVCVCVCVCVSVCACVCVLSLQVCTHASICAWKNLCQLTDSRLHYFRVTADIRIHEETDIIRKMILIEELINLTELPGKL